MKTKLMTVGLLGGSLIAAGSALASFSLLAPSGTSSGHPLKTSVLHTGPRTSQALPKNEYANPAVILFDFAKADLHLRKTSNVEFESMSREMSVYPYAKLEIDGYTDSIGPQGVNQKLSEERALAVRKALVERYGIPQERVVIRAFGKNRPESPNTTREGRRENRRVIVRVFRLEPGAAGSDKQTL